MKYSLYFLLFTCCLILSACLQKEATFLPNLKTDTSFIESENHSTEVSAESPQLFIMAESEDERLERYSQWVSFISAEVIRYDLNARTELIDILSPTIDAIKLRALLDESENAIAPNFNTSFRSYLVSYINFIEPNGRPNHNHDILPGLDDDDDVIILSRNSEVSVFLTYVLSLNCIELYFPKKLSFPEDFTITSTAHPLTSSDSNYGYLRYYDLGSISDINLGNPNDQSLVENVSVTPNYLELNDNIIVARPYRDDTGFNDRVQFCLYEDYPEDLTLFLHY